MAEDEQHLDPAPLLRHRDSIYAADLLMCAVAHFDFFTVLEAHQPATFADLVGRLRLAERPAIVLLCLLCAMRLVEKTGDRYSPTPLARQYLTSTSPRSLVPYYASVKHRPQCLEFRDLLLTGRPAGWSSRKGGGDWISSMRDPAFADAFTRAMDSRGTFLARELARRCELGPARSLLDIAGGSGVYACAFAARYPALRVDVLEIPPVDEAARRSIREKGYAPRVGVVQGDMFQALPAGYDLHLFANTFHDWDLPADRNLAARSFSSLAPGGRIIVFDAHLDDSMDGPLAVAEYSCLLVHSTEGRCYAKAEISQILARAGFVDIRLVEAPADRSAVIGTKE